MEIDKQRIAQLVKAVQNGDNNAFEELYKLTSQRAYFIALEFTKNNHDAEDILQDSYMKALSKINELDKPESFLSWFNQIVANKSKDFLKKKKPSLFETDDTDAFEIIPDENVSFSPEDNLDQNELQKIVMEVLDELSEEKRGCVLMMYFEDLSVKEIANTLEISEGTVKTRLFSARKDLKDKFSRHGITSLYSITPFGVVAWALRKAAESTSESFVASGASAKVLTSITVAGLGAEAVGASATAAAAGAAGASAASGAVTAGTSIGAKIAALSVAQKVIAGVSAAAVVAGGAAGIATVAENSNKNDDVSTTAYTEEYTTAPSFETTFAVEAMGTVEFSEITEFLTDESKSPENSVSKNPSTNRQSTTVKASVKSTSESPKRTTTTKSRVTNKVTTTKKLTTTKATTTKKETTTKQKAATTTIKATTTKKPTTTKKAPTTKVVTTKKPTTAKATTTKKETATKPVTTTVKPTTTKAATKGKATIIIKVIDLDNTVVDTLTYTVEEGTKMSSSYLWGLVESEGYSITGVFGSDKDTVAQAGQTYSFEAEL